MINESKSKGVVVGSILYAKHVLLPCRVDATPSRAVKDTTALAISPASIAD